MIGAAAHRILVVEDDPEIRHLLSVVLDDDDREIVSVVDGKAAREALRDGEPFDLVLLDLILPDLDGRTLLTGIRSDPATAPLPVIVISARNDPDIREDCHALGADVFVEKPFDPERLQRDVSVRLERSAGHERTGLRDPVTGLLNRAGLEEESERASESYGVALIQIDGFSSLSESWGWEVAEDAIQEMGGAIRETVGDDGRPGRLGGGEFAVHVPEPSPGESRGLAERVLDAIRSHPVTAPDGESLNLTASIGVVEVEAATRLEDALLQARRRLFMARQSGRNQVVASDAEEEDSVTRVLVAEDDEISATILLHRLEKEGLEVTRFDNGRDAYEAALDEVPDLVILDIKMPGMDGFEVLERLRRTPTYGDVPIILLTSMGSESDVVRGFNLGADDYVLKPFSPVELSARVWRLLRRGRSESAV